jgi:hypothetical protein
MRKFKFFQKPVKGDSFTVNGQTFITASFVPDELPPLHEWDTPQGHNGRRRLYFTDHPEYERQRQIREDLRTALRTNELTEGERLRVRHQAFQRMRNTNDDMERYFIENGFRDLNDNRVEPSLVTKPKLKWHQRFLNELMDDNKPHKLILLALFILGGITVLLHYYIQR